jgi:hypothetical protein
MNKFLYFLKTASPLILILVSVGIGIVAKIIEIKFKNIAMGLQLITFILFLYVLKRVGDKIFKK